MDLDFGEHHRGLPGTLVRWGHDVPLEHDAHQGFGRLLQVLTVVRVEPDVFCEILDAQDPPAVGIGAVFDGMLGPGVSQLALQKAQRLLGLAVQYLDSLAECIRRLLAREEGDLSFR